MNLKRRHFLGALASCMTFAPLLPLTARAGSRRANQGKRRVETLNTAKNVIFIRMEGGPSHLDTFDLKTGSWTPAELGASTLGGFLKWPSGTMPKLAERFNDFSIVRSIYGEEVVHERGMFHLATGYREGTASRTNTPHMGSVIAMLKENATSQSSEERILPPGVTFSLVSFGSGILPGQYKLGLMDQEKGYPNLTHGWDDAEDRFKLLSNKTYETNDPRAVFLHNQERSRLMAADERISSIADFEGLPTFDNDFSNAYIKQMRMAVNMLGLDLGIRFIELGLDGWDSHQGIYDPNEFWNIFNLSHGFDDAFSYLLDELKARPGSAGGTLLDETLIVVAGEFGRTPGDIDSNGGRDHYADVIPALLAGGGIKGGEVVGASDDRGAFITDVGWNRNRYIGFHDLQATVYSALGIDWTQTLDVDGTPFALTDPNAGPAFAIDSLFKGV